MSWDQHTGAPLPRTHDFSDHDPDEKQPLIYWLGLGAWRQTRGSARVDIVRPSSSQPPRQAGIFGLPRIRPDAFFRAPTLPDEDYPGAHRHSSLLGPISGARVQLMRHIDWGGGHRRRRRNRQPIDQDTSSTREAEELEASHRRSYGVRPALGSIKRTLWEKMSMPDRPLIDLGVGFNFDLDNAALLPKARIKIKDLFSIKLMPLPCLKLQKRWQLPGSATAIRFHYDVPINELLAWDTRKPVPARMWVRLENNVGKNIHLTPSGLDFDEHVWHIGRGMALRAGGSAQFPREIPVPRGQSPLTWRLQRLGIKTRW
ncbi:hypothetical protein WJX73_009191 [Symbiochloris irregularis]|uniref:DUF2169 domain-containing protein n=1 Tax=Symbiochloris irregularis TaxID=706552 RepID=A0AAW1PQY6_9CHLO